MVFMLSQTQDIAGQQSFVWDFFRGGGGGGRVLKYLHRGLLGFTGSPLKSGHYKHSQCMTLLQCLWSVMLSTFPPFGNVCWEDAYCRVVMVDYALHLAAVPCPIRPPASEALPPRVVCWWDQYVAKSQHLYWYLYWWSMSPLFFFCSLVNNSYFFCRTWRNICCYWCKRITTKCKWGICNFQWGPQVFFCSLILQINVNTNLILFRNHW